MITITIILAVLLFAAAFIAGVSIRHSNSVDAKYKKQCWLLNIHKDALKVTDPKYYVQLIDNKMTVTRVVYVDGYMVESIIKVFDDEDFEFNIRCAEELCEHLNEK